MVRAPENRVKFVHSLGRYVGPLGAEAEDRNHNRYFGFKGDRTRRGNPPMIQFKTTYLVHSKVRLHAVEDVEAHFGEEDAAVVMPVDETEVWKMMPSLVMIPVKWAAGMMEQHPYPKEFLDYILQQTAEWSDAEKVSADFIVNWAVAACNATNKTSGKALSQLGMHLGDVDVMNEACEDWAEARLAQTIGSRTTAATTMGGGRLEMTQLAQ